MSVTYHRQNPLECICKEVFCLRDLNITSVALHAEADDMLYRVLQVGNGLCGSVVAFWICRRRVVGSDVGQHSKCSDWRLSLLYSVPPNIYLDSTTIKLQFSKFSSFHNSSFILSSLLLLSLLRQPVTSHGFASYCRICCLSRLRLSVGDVGLLGTGWRREYAACSCG
jgi:hypothetical protein